jgi:hypothetical protein
MQGLQKEPTLWMDEDQIYIEQNFGLQKEMDL